MKVVFMGTPEFAVPSLNALVEAGHDVVGVFTQPDRPKGRGAKAHQSPVKEYALSQGIRVFQPDRIRLDGMRDLRALAPEVCVTAAFGQILSQDVLEIPPMGTVNVHASLLPRHRGAAPVQWAILQGDAETGVTTMLTDRGIDTGDMLLRAACPIERSDTAGMLLAKLSHMGAKLLLDTLACLEVGNCPREKQEEAAATYDPMLTKKMGLLDFCEGTQACLRRVRAMEPWPCACANLGAGVLKVWKAREAEALSHCEGSPPGMVLCAGEECGLAVCTSDGAIELLEIQAPGGKRMDTHAFLRGHRLPAGIRLDEVRL